MAFNRATKSGFAAEAQQKMMSKYDQSVGAEAMEWINALTGLGLDTRGDADSVIAQLKDGMVLIKLGKALGMKSNASLDKPSTMSFKCMEKINHFTDFMSSDFGVKKIDNFQTVDLYEGGNPTQVVCSLHALGRKAQVKGFRGIGPKESEENRRSFTAEQMSAGQNVIGLQMGTNKGANQSGMNMGNMRHIVD